MGWTCAIILGILGPFALVCIPHNLRVWRVRRRYRALTREVRDQVFQLIRTAAAKGPAVIFLYLNKEFPCREPEIIILSHVGGVPYAEAGDTWPTRHGNPDPKRHLARFLLQVRLDDPSLGQQWQGRLMVVFL